jgi:transcriptional regulator with XRE-family HTH domain
MKKKTLVWIGGLLIALLVVGVVGATAVYAQEPTNVFQHGRGPGGGRGLLGSAELEAAAKALGMTTDELSTALKDGKTLEQLATEKGVDFQIVMQAIQAVRPPRLGSVELEAAAKALGMTTDELSSALKEGKTLQELADAAGVKIEDVQAAIQAAHATELRDRIQQAVDDGTITQENANWLLEGLDKGFIGVPGAFGFGGHGHGFGMGPLEKPAQQSTQ